MSKSQRFSLIATLFLFAGSNAFGQATTSSPYSAYGVGNPLPQTNATAKGMGEIGTALRMRDNVNMANPASYTSLVMTNIDVSIHANYNQLRNSVGKENSGNFAFDHFALSFPISKKMGGSFGLRPYSASGYQLGRSSDLVLEGSDDVLGPKRNLLQGEGGFSQAYIGAGYQLNEKLSVGANVSYLFGDIERTQSLEFEDASLLNSRTQIRTSASGILLNYGVQYELMKTDEKSWTLGYAGTLQSKVSTKEGTVTDRYVLANNEPSPIDTVVNSSVDGNLTLPMKHSLGLVYTQGNKLVAGVDVDFQQWSNYATNGVKANFKDMYGIKLGAQYTPDAYAINSYMKKVDYRVGLNYTKSYLNIDGHNINEMNLTLGLGLPMSSQFFGGLLYTGSKLNMALQLGTRGTTASGLIAERYASLYLGFTLNDRWFVKRKFD